MRIKQCFKSARFFLSLSFFFDKSTFWKVAINLAPNEYLVISINVKCEVLTAVYLSGYCCIFLCLSFILCSFPPSYPKKAYALQD